MSGPTMPTSKLCIVCGTLTDQTRCPTHRRGNRHQRGYDYQFVKAQQSPEYRNATRCETCGQPFTTDNPKTAGHRRDIRHGGTTDDGLMAQCRDCNYGWRRDT